MQASTAYIGLGVHSRTCTMAWMNESGDCWGPSTFQTSGQTIRKKIDEIKADQKVVTLEEGPLAFWTARTLEEAVDRIVVCDPRENYLISRAARKDDEADAKALARLLRLGEVKEVYQPSGDRRALFRQAASHYTDLRDQLRKLKQKIKARLRRWGLWDIPSADVYSKSGRRKYFEKLSHDRIRTQVASFVCILSTSIGIHRWAISISSASEASAPLPAFVKVSKSQLLRLLCRLRHTARASVDLGILPS